MQNFEYFVKFEKIGLLEFNEKVYLGPERNFLKTTQFSFQIERVFKSRLKVGEITMCLEQRLNSKFNRVTL